MWKHAKNDFLHGKIEMPALKDAGYYYVTNGKTHREREERMREVCHFIKAYRNMLHEVAK